jgi:hypothetical protein
MSSFITSRAVPSSVGANIQPHHLTILIHIFCRIMTRRATVPKFDKSSTFCTSTPPFVIRFINYCRSTAPFLMTRGNLSQLKTTPTQLTQVMLALSVSKRSTTNRAKSPSCASALHRLQSLATSPKSITAGGSSMLSWPLSHTRSTSATSMILSGAFELIISL